MRICRPTYFPSGRLRPAALALAAIAAACLTPALAGCGSSGQRSAPANGALTVYSSLPRAGVSARAADAVAAGERLALADAGGRAADRRVRLVELDSSAPGGQTWDPSAVEANARRASDDPTAVAYVGELDFGGSAVSAPVTNRTALLQVSPGDGLTTLTRPDAAQPEEGPARYYPSGHRNFVRLVATDAQQAAALVAWARNRGARRLAIVRDDRLFGRELAAEAVTAAAAGHVPVVTVQEARQGAADYTELVRDLAPTRPDAIVYTGLGDQSGERVLSALAGALPTVPIYGSSALASALPGAALPPADVLKNVAPASAYGPAARRLLQRLHEQTGAPVAPEALYGYDAMRLVLDALGTPGVRPGDRASVTRAALRPRLRRSILGDYTVLPSGDVAPVRLAGYRRAGGRLAFLGLRPVVPGSTSAPTP